MQMEVLATSLCVLSAAVSSCAGFTLEEAAATSQETEREAKMLFSNSALNMMAINELRWVGHLFSTTNFTCFIHLNIVAFRQFIIHLCPLF